MSALTAREAVTETSVAQYALEKGVLVLKLNVTGRRGWPDRLFLYKGRVMFIEFKREGEMPRKLQEWIHGHLRSHGFDVHVVDSIGEGRAIIDHFAESCANL